MLRNDWIGETIGARYQIDELLGQDGLSSTYRATDVDLRQAVAIKIIHPYLSIDPGFLRRFQEEAPAIARLRHPHIVRITDYDHDSGRYFLVHELVPGETLQNRLSRLQAQKQLLPVEKAIEIAIQICDAVHYTHRRGSVHREIKPASIMLDINGEALLMDFGMAWILDGQSQLMNGAMLSKAIYMSPEQIKGEKLDRRTDIYSLGVVLFEMVCGRPPFEA
ncbi:MAG: serine/threonine protein kinase, partial [Chloroflexota bacterium]